MELVRYRPGEAIRWLETGAENIRKGAQNKGMNLIKQAGTDSKTFSENLKTIPYDRVIAIHQRGDRTVFTLDKGTVTIKPFAYIVSGRIKVPVGWVRNGIEVPYELITLELAARCGVEVQEE